MFKNDDGSGYAYLFTDKNLIHELFVGMKETLSDEVYHERLADLINAKSKRMSEK